MPDRSLRSEADQDRVLLEIYSLSHVLLRGKVAKQDVEDAVHDITTDCLVKLRSGVWAEAPENLQEFVLKLVKEYVIARKRRRVAIEECDAEHLRAREAMPPAWVSPDPSDHEESISEFQRHVLSRVPNTCRAAYYAVREQGASYEEAGEKLRITPDIVRHYVKIADRAFQNELRALDIAVPAHPRRGTTETKWRTADARFGPPYVSHEPANALD